MVGGKEAPLNAPRLSIVREHPRPSIYVVPLHLSGQRHDLQPFRSSAGNRASGSREHHKAVCTPVSPPYFESVDQPGDFTTAFPALRTGDVAAKVPKHHLHYFFFRDIPLEQEGNRFGYSPAILAQQPFPQQAEMFVAPFVLSVSELNPDFILANVDWECLQIIAFIIKATSALEIEAAAMPVARKNAVPDRSSSQRIAHMRTLVVGCVDPAAGVEQSDAAAFSEPDSFSLTSWDIAVCSHAYPLRCRFDHEESLSFDEVP
jgi:hypothetical protein